jgi:hypothetical protein
MREQETREKIPLAGVVVVRKGGSPRGGFAVDAQLPTSGWGEGGERQLALVSLVMFDCD